MAFLIGAALIMPYRGLLAAGSGGFATLPQIPRMVAGLAPRRPPASSAVQSTEAYVFSPILSHF